MIQRILRTFFGPFTSQGMHNVSFTQHSLLMMSFARFMRRHLDSKAQLYDFPRMYTGVMRLVKKFDASELQTVFSSELRAVWPSNLRDAEARWQLHSARWDNVESVAWPERRLYSHPDPGEHICNKMLLHVVTLCRLWSANGCRS